jgi:hypothetical protein
MLAMEDAGFVIGSYVITFAVVGGARLAHRAARTPVQRRASTRRQSTGPDEQ